MENTIPAQQLTQGKPMEALFRPALILMCGRFLGFIFAFAIPMVLVRLFDQNEFGTYKQLFLIYSTLFGIAQMGMAESLYYFLPRNSSNSGKYVLNSLIVLASLGLIFLGLLWILQANVANLLNNSALIGYIPYIGIFMLFMLMGVLLEIVMTARKRHMAASCAYAVSDFLRAFLFITPALVFSSIEWLLLGAIGFAACRFSATLVYLKHEFRIGLRPDCAVLKKHLLYALPFGLAALIEIVQMNFHMYAVSYHFDTATFAIYAVGCLQLPVVDFLMTSTANVMMVNMQDKLRVGKSQEVLAIWLDATRKLALLLFPIVGGLLVVAHELIVLLFTDAYERSVPIFMIWTVSMAFAALLTDGVLRVFAQIRFLIFQNVIRLIVVVIMVQWFLQRFELTGAVLVTLLAMGVAKIMALTRIKMILQVSLIQLLPWKSLGVIAGTAVLAALPAILVKSALTLPDLPLLLISGLIYSLSYYLLLLWYGPMDETEKRMLTQWPRVLLTRLIRGS